MITLTEGITEENLHALYADPFMARIGDDGMGVEPIYHPLVKYLSAFVDGEFVGAYLVIEFSHTEYEAHSLLQKKATRYSRRIGRLLIEWTFAHDDINRLTGYVREGLQSAVNHCLKMGFKYEGFRRDALLVNGEPKGIHVLGITRRDWSESK